MAKSDKHVVVYPWMTGQYLALQSSFPTDVVEYILSFLRYDKDGYTGCLLCGADMTIEPPSYYLFDWEKIRTGYCSCRCDMFAYYGNYSMAVEFINSMRKKRTYRFKKKNTDWQISDSLCKGITLANIRFLFTDTCDTSTVPSCVKDVENYKDWLIYHVPIWGDTVYAWDPPLSMDEYRPPDRVFNTFNPWDSISQWTLYGFGDLSRM